MTTLEYDSHDSETLARSLLAVPGIARVRVKDRAAWVVPATEVLERQARMQESIWKTVFERTFEPEGERHSRVWGSSYTGQPIPADEIEQWLDGTVARILSLTPHDVLEIGCGDGQIMTRLLSRCGSYVGLDLSEAAVRNVERQLATRGIDKARVEQRSAMELDGLGPFDTIILNSVAQYFPTQDMLFRVIRRATELLVPGGALFLGDLRDLDLAELFYTSVELAKGDEDLAGRIRTRSAAERELLVSPSIGWHLLEAVPGVTSVHVGVKPGDAENELVRFRFDMIVRVGATVVEPPVASPFSALAPGLLTGLPNGRLAGLVAASANLDKLPIARLRELSRESAPVTLRAIEDFARASGLEVEVGRGEGTTWTTLLTKERRLLRAFGMPPAKPLSACTTHPALAQIAPRLVKKLAGRVPSDMRVEIVPALDE